jgi:hypothetical protein
MSNRDSVSLFKDLQTQNRMSCYYLYNKFKLSELLYHPYSLHETHENCPLNFDYFSVFLR